MALTPGTRLGPYDITAQIGVGGMGEVYRATDTKLKRDVAIKVLPAALAADGDRLARFQREAEVLASLNHPNIAAIYGLEEAPSTGSGQAAIKALVMELVEGPTLADRIARGAMPIDEALPIAKQIAEALEAAHEQGIIHRDLKPANIKVRPDGTVKVLDFGLAKAMEPGVGGVGGAAGGGAGIALSQSPTITTPAMTQAGMILGTAAYMSPEQARGQVVDRRTDLWAFGAVLYEMLVGQRAFEGATVSDTLAAVLKTEPSWTALPADTPAPVRTVLRRCLEKERRRRLESAADARLEVEEAQRGSSSLQGQPASASPTQARRAWLVAAGLGTIAAALAVALAMTLRPGPAPSEIRLEIATPPTSVPLSIALSPDGQSVVFAAMGEGGSQLFLRALSSGVARPLAGTMGATFPFWSPDGRSIAFFAGGSLMRLDIDNGSMATLTPTGNQGQGGAWSADGTILFVPGGGSVGVRRISSSGAVAPAAVAVERQGGQRFPRFLPDGRHFLFYASGGDDVRGVYVGGADGFRPKRILDGETSAPVFASLGHLFFVRQGTLFAQPFDLDLLTLTGRPTRLAEDVSSDEAYRTALSVSESGTVIYRTGAVSVRKQFVWFSRAGDRLGVAGEAAASHTSPSMSRDGRRVAWHRVGDGNVDVWLFDLERAFSSRFTRDASSEIYPVWSPDASQVAFSSGRNGAFDLYRKATSGGDPELLLSTSESKIALDWSADGRFILYRTARGNLLDLWAVPLQSGQKAFPVVATSANEWGGQFSPDSKWLAYESDESGRREVYLQPFPGPGARIQVSTSGGAQVRWRRDGSELFYIGLDERLMAVSVRFSADGRSARVDAPAALFPTRVGGAVPTNSGPLYMVSPDGQRFLMDTVVDEGPASPISVILNWAAGGN